MVEVSGGYFSEVDLAVLGFRHLGENVRVSRRAEIQHPPSVRLMDNVRIDAFTVVTTGDCGFLEVGENTHIADSVRLNAAGGLVIGRYVGLSTRVTVLSASDDFSGNHLVGPLVPEEARGTTYAFTRVGDFAVVGTSSTIFPGCSVSEGVAVGAMSLVNRPLPPWGIYAGNPARFLRERERGLLEYLDSGVLE